MGNGVSSSNNVKPIAIEQQEKRVTFSTNDGRRHSCDVEELKRNLIESEESRHAAEEKLKKKKKELVSLEQQVANLESVNLDLKDHIQILEERLDQAYRRNVITEEKPCEETLQLKDQYIKKLEEETKKVQAETAKLKTKTKKKIRAAHTQVAETKQESSLKIFEMKDEIAKLEEENRRLQEQSNGKSEAKSSNDFLSSSGADDARTKIILQLSQQISEQNAKITALENSQREKESSANGSRENSFDNLADGKLVESGRPLSNSRPQSIQKMASFIEDSESDLGSRVASPSGLLCKDAESETLFHRVTDEMDELRAITQEMQRVKKKKKKTLKKRSKKNTEKGAELKSPEYRQDNEVKNVERNDAELNMRCTVDFGLKNPDNGVENSDDSIEFKTSLKGVELNNIVNENQSHDNTTEEDKRQWSSTSRDSGYGR